MDQAVVRRRRPTRASRAAASAARSVSTIWWWRCPANQPDIVVVGGVATPTFGEATIRSIDAGASFSGFGNDAQNPRNTSHVDVRAVVFHPRDPDIAWVGSDGGVVRNDGDFTSITSRCGSSFGNAAQCQTMLSRVPTRLYFLNKGLQTMQFYNVSVDPQAPLRRLIGGLQDNGTIWLDGSTNDRVWKPLFPSGDGTSASGFHPTRAAVVFASVQSNRFFANFRNGDLAFWVRTDDPITRAGERESITQSTRPAVPDVRCGAARHAVHRLPAHLAHAEQRRPAGGARSRLPRVRRQWHARPDLRRLAAARRGVPVPGGLDGRLPQPPAGRSRPATSTAPTGPAD